MVHCSGHNCIRGQCTATSGWKLARSLPTITQRRKVMKRRDVLKGLLGGIVVGILPKLPALVKKEPVKGTRVFTIKNSPWFSGGPWKIEKNV